LVVVGIAAMFATSIDPHSLMILATATYLVLWLGSFGVTWYRRGPRQEPPGADNGRSGADRAEPHDRA
jgi:hypothetical protein